MIGVLNNAYTYKYTTFNTNLMKESQGRCSFPVSEHKVLTIDVRLNVVRNT